MRAQQVKFALCAFETECAECCDFSSLGGAEANRVESFVESHAQRSFERATIVRASDIPKESSYFLASSPLLEPPEPGALATHDSSEPGVSPPGT